MSNDIIMGDEVLARLEDLAVIPPGTTSVNIKVVAGKEVEVTVKMVGREELLQLPLFARKPRSAA
jgi:hypothetical protein